MFYSIVSYTDKMSLLNDSLKNISLKELCVFIIFLFLIYYSLNYFNIISFNSVWVYIIIIFYFSLKLRNGYADLKNDFLEVFSKDLFKNVLLIVILNIFFSYGMLYLSDFILKIFPTLNLMVNFVLTPCQLNNSLIYAFGFIATIFISPISEELIFRGVLLNKMQIIFPVTFSIVITSLLFAALHSFGSLTSAFVFSMCMAILYIKTQNILVPIFAHFLNNLIAESLVVIDSQSLLFTNEFLMIIISILAIISIVVIVKSLIAELNNIK